VEHNTSGAQAELKSSGHADGQAVGGRPQVCRTTT
jgi:hypothetical protein